eukprot:Hpha_TRINITY_DN15761_c6_g6::TRINITY_DN15761_c6_g6_i1::g.38595::m.38595/K07407/E3.2.1.22B, galA, rafA; alpha-galactosidase
MRALLPLLGVAGWLHAAGAKLVVPQWISDGMVLQTNHEYGARSFLNGVSDVGKVHVSAVGQTYTVDTDSDGRWQVMLNPSSRANFSIDISNDAGDKITVNGASFGDVYFCSGQSNMVFPLKLVLNATQEIATLAKFPQLHFFQTNVVWEAEPQDTIPDGACAAGTGQCQKWLSAAEAAQDKYIDGFSAMCFLTAREIARLHSNGGLPIGIVQSAVGGTRVEAWMPKDGFDLCPEYKDKVPSRSGNNNATGLYNAMVHPFTHMSIRAALWYQGEANADEKIAGVDQTAYYACMYQAMIAKWREEKGMGDFAWLTQQLPPSVVSGTPMSKQLTTGRVQVRLAEAVTLPHTDGLTDISGMSVGLDMGGSSGWGVDHPPNKNEMSRRMALQAVHTAFAVQGRMSAAAVSGTYLEAYDSYWTGPVFASAASEDAAVRVRFAAGTASGISLKDVRGFNVDGTRADCTKCCAQGAPFEVLKGQNWTAVSEGDTEVDGETLVLKGTAGATAVRYAWSDFVECVLVNNDSLPLGPFVANLTGERVRDLPLVKERDSQIQSPPLGFNSWNFYHCNIDENTVKQVIDAMVANGMKAAGYEFVNIDDCWQVGRMPNGTIIVDPVRFPSGMRHLADYAHSKGMKFGVYTARAEFTCQGRPGSYQHEVIDADTYCEWGIDYLKIDQCGGAKAKNASSSWIQFHERFQACYKDKGHFIVQSVESCDSPQTCGQWVPKMANTWRTGADVQANFGSVMHNAAVNNKMADIATPGHFNDADMLEIGNVGLSYEEQVSHMSLWCIMASPLLAGTDLVHASKQTLSILTNRAALAVNQDLGVGGKIQGRLVKSTAVQGGDLQVWTKQLSTGGVAVLLVNTGDQTQDITVQWGDISVPVSTPLKPHDIWKGSDLPAVTGNYTAKGVASHACAFLTLNK